MSRSNSQAADEPAIDVSIVIPAYNAAHWIEETLASVRPSADVRVEMIVVDDGSTDDTSRIVASRFPRAILVRQANQGVSAARANGSALARGKYIKYLDSDDMLIAGAVERQVSLAEGSNADVIYSAWQKLMRNGDEGWRISETISRRIEDVNPDVELAFFSDMWCTTAAYLWRAEFLTSRHPGWSLTLPVIQDARFALDAAFSGASFVYDPQPAALYRCHSTNSVSTRSAAAFNRDLLTNGREVHEIWRSRGTLNPGRKQALLNLCETLGLETYATDTGLAREYFAFARSIDERWRPNQTRFRRWIATVGGVNTLARARHWANSLRKLLGPRGIPLQ